MTFQRLRSSLTAKQILGFLSVALVPLIVMAALYFYTLSTLIIETAKQDLELGASHTAQTLDSFVAVNINNLQSQAQLADLTDYLTGDEAYRAQSAPRISTLFRSLGRVTYEGYLQSFLLFDENGIVIYDQTQLDIGKDYSAIPSFQDAWQSSYPRVIISPSEAHGGPSICFSIAVWDDEKKVGVFAIRYNLSVIQYIIDEASRLDNTDSFAIVTQSNGNVIGWHRQPNPPQATLDLGEIESLSLKRHVDIDGEEYALVVLPTTESTLNVIYVRPEESMSDYISARALTVWIVSFVTLLFTISFAIFMANRTLKPIRELTGKSQALSEGNWSARVEITTIDELGQLGATFNQMADQIRAEIKKVEALNEDLLQAYNYTLDGWARALELRDKETKGHSQRVTALTLGLGKAMDLSKKDLTNIQFGSQLHDIGKMVIPDEILHKPGPLTKEERETMKKHPVYAYQILKDIKFLEKAIDIPHYHHEKWDGSGYPSGLKETDIPLFARIFCVADVWDAITSDRPYNAAWSKEKAIAYLRSQKGKHFDPEIVDIFLSDVIR